MPRRLAMILSLLMSPAAAQEANLAPAAEAAAGAASQLVLAQRVFWLAGETGDPVLLLAAIRLARGVTLRPAPAWERTTTGDAEPPHGLDAGGPPDPGGPAALAVLLGLAIDDPDLQDLAYDLDAQLPQGRLPVATVAKSGLSGGALDEWRLPLSGAVAAEIALLGDGGTPLALTVTDEGGTVVCALPAMTEASLCRVTPARNGFFTVQVKNAGAGWNSYQLVGN
jgi:hypothetical protein